MSIQSLFVAWSEKRRCGQPMSCGSRPSVCCKVASVHFGYHYRIYRTFLASCKPLAGLILPTVSAASVDNKLANIEIASDYYEPNTAQPESCDISSTELPEASNPAVIVTEDEVRTFIAGETGRDRLRSMFTVRPDNNFSPELSNVVVVTGNCSFMFFLLTSVVGSRKARERFIEKNKSTKYETKFLALRAFNDAVMFGGLKVGLTWGIKSAFFAGTFMLISQSIASYRNKTSVVEYITAGGLTCALLRMHLGLRGMVAGGVIGSALGLVGGGIFSILLYAAKETQQHRHFREIQEILIERREIGLITKSKSVDLSTISVQPATTANVAS